MIGASNACDDRCHKKMTAKYELVLGKCRQEPCAHILVVLPGATCIKVKTYTCTTYTNFGKYNRCKNVITMSGLPKLEVL